TLFISMEWIETTQLINVKHLADGGCASIYTAIWVDGYPRTSKGLRLRRGPVKVAIKPVNIYYCREEAKSMALMEIYCYFVLAYDMNHLRVAEVFGLTLIQTERKFIPERCWHDDPAWRPSAKELRDVLAKLLNPKVYVACQEADEFRKKNPEPILEEQTIHTSKYHSYIADSKHE
ncbi:2026_t:CDS:2, partial [Racocetra persica]